MNLTADLLGCKSWPQRVKALLDKKSVSYTSFAGEIGVRRETVSRWWKEPHDANPDHRTITAILTFCRQYNPSITYEDLFETPQQKAS